MKVTVTEARERLPELLRQIQEDRGLRVQITTEGQVAAELRASLPDPPPGEAARRLRALATRMPRPEGEAHAISENVDEHLYGKSWE
jgi:antitoxin (DNA-binding transcriptional repressor) of toxin-antitoxin stability system